MTGRTANMPPAEAVDHGYEDAVSQAGIDIGEFIVDLVKKNPMMNLDADTLKDVTSSALTSLTLYIEDPDSPFQEERED